MKKNKKIDFLPVLEKFGFKESKIKNQYHRSGNYTAIITDENLYIACYTKQYNRFINSYFLNSIQEAEDKFTNWFGKQ